MTEQKMKDITVLVLEDERPLSEAIRIKLENAGCDVAVARTVDQAMNYLEDLAHVDAIWLDHYLLGKENGLDFLAKIKVENSPWKDIPVFVVSNTASHDKVQSYMRLGVKNYYVKANHRLADIISDIRQMLSGGENEQK